MTSDEIRDGFLRFFEAKGHTILPSSSLVPHGDPTLLLTTAGMVQIKPYFLGLETPPNPRLASCQKCFRTTDIEQVGDNKHLTFFEMLGNFSVGDYFKKEAIEWAWEFVTQPQWLGLLPDRLWITIFLDDEEAFDCWRKIGIAEERIVRLGEEDNFWGPAGDSGPCGPCSEIHYDFGEDLGCGKPDCGPACDCPRFSEIWNLVFTEYDQDREGKRIPLPKPNIDTGMGLERIAAVMQGKISVYETDLFTPIVAKVEELSGKKYGEDKNEGLAIRIVAEHIRGIVFLIADGVLPSNEGRGYVLRRLIRRASLFGRKLGINQRFLENMADQVIERMKHVYPEQLPEYDNSQRILEVVDQEEKQFHNTLDVGLFQLDGIMGRAKDEGRKIVSGEEVFQLHDTYGFPKELTEEIASENGLCIDSEGFEQEMERQRERARAAHKFNTGDQSDLGLYEQLGISRTNFVGYDRLGYSSGVVGLIVDGKPVETASEGDEVDIILKETPFYGEMGGQVGDSGEISGNLGKVTVVQVTRPRPDIVVHRAKVTEGRIAVNDQVEAKVDQAQRLDIARNHTATHLLQAALRAVLGEQVRQSGSLVAADRLRFDFTHLGSVTKEQLAEIQHIVNEKIRQNLPVVGETMSYTDAVSKGAIALFGEKYGDEVRMLQVGDPPISLELCGGTHVKSTGEIGFFHITNEGSIGSGMRRIEAVTGRGAEKFLEQRLSTLNSLAQELETSPEEVQDKLSATLQELSRERKRALSLELELAKKQAEELLTRVESIGGINLVSAKVSATNPDIMRGIGDQLKQKLESGMIVLGAVYNDKPNFIVMVTSDLVADGLKAGEIVKQIAKVAGGGGGGKAEIGQGSGKDKEKLDIALDSVKDIVLELTTEDEDSLIKRGSSLGDSGRYEEALASFDKAIKLNPDNVECWLNKGWVLGTLGRHEEAIACYDKAIELDPMDDLPWFNKGNRLGDLGRYEEALACYDEVLRMNPMDVPALYYRGKILSDFGRYEEALACYDEAIEIHAYNSDIWYNKGLTLEQLGQKSEAEECFQRAKELDSLKAN